MKKNIAYFSLPVIESEIQFNEKTGALSKKGLLLVEGTWKDNKGREWQFDKNKVKRIANNTNAAFNDGIRIPLIKDHVNTQDNTVGDLNSIVETRIITEDDLPDKRHKNLIGRLGIFASDVAVKSSNIIKQIQEGLVSTISPGVDMVKETIKEISLTPMPAIAGLSLFNQGSGTSGLTWDEIMQSDADIAQLKEQYDELSDKFFTLVTNIMQTDDELFESGSQEDYLNQAIEGYCDLLYSLFGLEENEEGEDSEEYTQDGQMPLEMLPDGSYGMGNTARYSMFDEDNLAEFGFMGDAFNKGMGFTKNLIKKPGLGIKRLRRSYKLGAKSGGMMGGIKYASAAAKPYAKSALRPVAKIGALTAGGIGAYQIGKAKQRQQTRNKYPFIKP